MLYVLKKVFKDRTGQVSGLRQSSTLENNQAPSAVPCQNSKYKMVRLARSADQSDNITCSGIWYDLIFCFASMLKICR